MATAKATRVFVVNNRPVHVHSCSGGTEGQSHSWDCDSPYCEVMKADCPDHGGFEPVAVGREPWRGR